MKKLIVAGTSAGLCNRLWCMIGSQRIADEMDRDLFIHWPVNHNVPCLPDELFANQFRLLDHNKLPFIFDPCYSLKVYQPDVTPTHREVDIKDQSDVILIRSWSEPCFLTDRDDGWKQLRPHIDRLRPARDIKNKIDGFTIPARTIGVHIRKSDGAELYAPSKIEHFEELMDHTVRMDPSVNFFLATDLFEIEQHMRNRYGKKIICTVKAKDGLGARISRDGMVEAIVDLYLLSRTIGIIGTTCSSYTNYAGFLGRLTVIHALAESCVNKDKLISNIL